MGRLRGSSGRVPGSTRQTDSASLSGAARRNVASLARILPARGDLDSSQRRVVFVGDDAGGNGLEGIAPGGAGRRSSVRTRRQLLCEQRARRTPHASKLLSLPTRADSRRYSPFVGCGENAVAITSCDAVTAFSHQQSALSQSLDTISVGRTLLSVAFDFAVGVFFDGRK